MRAADFFVAVATFALCSPAYTDDPCVACGRLIIQIVGAGELPNNSSSGVDALEYDAVRHLKQFSPRESGKLPVRVILMSSTPGLIKRAKSLSEARGIQIGVVPNSIDSFKRLTESEDSALRVALKAFEASPLCRDAMQKRGLESVLPLLKIDILIVSEYTRSDDSGAAIPIWSSSDRSGSVSDWNQDGRRMLTSDNWKALINILHGATIHTYVNACKAGSIGAAFEAVSDDAGCSCFLASTNQTQDDFGGGNAKPTFNNAIDDGDQFEKKATNTWSGARNIADMIPALYKKHEAMIFPKDTAKDNPYKFIENTNPRNPLVGFIYTSADALTEEGLKKLSSVVDENPNGLPKTQVKALSTSKDFKENARGAFWAQATDELPSIRSDLGGSNEMVKRIKEQIAAINQSYAFVYEEEDGRRDSIEEFGRYLDSFVDCTTESSKQTSQCKDLVVYIDSLFTRADPGFVRSPFKRVYNRFMEELGASQPKATWRAYIANEISLGDAFENLHKLRMAYLDLAKEFSSFLGSGESAEKLAFDQMTSDFDAAFSAIKKPMFKALRKDALRLKLAKIEIATRLVAEHPDALPPGYADEFLKKMSRKLDCLTRIPVGPMFDKEAAALNARR